MSRWEIAKEILRGVVFLVLLGAIVGWGCVLQVVVSAP